MSKLIGYIIAVIGLVGIAVFAIPSLKTSLPFLQGLSDTILLVVSILIIVVGLFLVRRGGGGLGGGGKKQQELPIYRGKDVIGYRRTS